jgi:hypothetical protein
VGNLTLLVGSTLSFVAGRDAITVSNSLTFGGGQLRCTNTSSFQGCLISSGYEVFVNNASSVVGVGPAFQNPKPFGTNPPFQMTLTAQLTVTSTDLLFTLDAKGTTQTVFISGEIGVQNPSRIASGNVVFDCGATGSASIVAQDFSTQLVNLAGASVRCANLLTLVCRKARKSFGWF